MNIVHIIPTYNEKENIGMMIDTLTEIGAQHPQWKQQILVVDDRSPDGTSQVVVDYQKKQKGIHLLLKEKEGLGKALIQGYEYAVKELHADVVIPNDADFQWDPHDFPKLMKKIEEGYDVVVASRHVPGGRVIGWSWFRKLNHDVSNSLLAWWVAGVREVHDHAGNFKAIRVKGVLDQVPLHAMVNAGFSFQLHILYELSKTKAKFYEVPSVFRERKFGQSKIGFNKYYIRDVFEYVKNSLMIRADKSKSFIKYCIVGGVGFTVQTIISKILISFGLHAGLSVSLGAEGAIVTNFLFNNRWTFRHKRIFGFRPVVRKFVQFNTVAIGAVIIQGSIVSIGTYLYGVSAWFISMILAIVCVVIPYSYFMYNRFIWKKH